MNDDINLEKATSPFIRMHSDDAIDWLPYTKESLKFAATEKKPVFLYIGSLSSIWSINMHKETFNDKHTVNILSLYFTCIIADREEHPELEFVYNNAVQAMTGKSGRPVSVFLTPEMKPFFGGTYFPAEDFENLPSLRTVINNIATVWNNNPASLLDSAHKVNLIIEKNLKLVEDLPSEGDENLDFEIHWAAFLYNYAFDELKKNFNDEHKGFGKGSRFPHPEKLAFLLRYFSATDHTESLDMVVSTLDKVADSALTDQLSGGFHRYCIDENWLRPSFEKHLAENAAIIRVFLEAYQITESQKYETVIADAVSFILKQLRDEETGVFYNSVSSVTEDSDPNSYFWNYSILSKIVDAKYLNIIAEHFGLVDDTDRALAITQSVEKLAKKHGMEESEIESAIIEAKREMWKAYKARKQPIVDKKATVYDNALMISTLATAYGTMSEPGYLQAAEAALNHILKNQFKDANCMKSYFDGECAINAKLDDFGALINALIDVYECNFDLSLLKKAKELTCQMTKQFWDKKESVFRINPIDNSLSMNYVPFFDEGKPAALALALSATERVYNLTKENELKQVVDSLIHAIKPTAFKLPQAMLYTISSLYSKRCHNLEIAFSGDISSDEGRVVYDAVKFNFVPSATIVHLNKGISEDSQKMFPIIGKNMQYAESEKAAVHFCEFSTASEGISKPETIEFILCPNAKLGEEEL